LYLGASNYLAPALAVAELLVNFSDITAHVLSCWKVCLYLLSEINDDMMMMMMMMIMMKRITTFVYRITSSTQRQTFSKCVNLDSDLLQ